MATLNFDNPAITFSDAGLSGESSNNPTAMMFARSGEPVLFVAQLDGTIKRYVIEKQLDGTFAVANAKSPNQTGPATQNILTVKNEVENYNDVGEIATGNQTDQRQITGLVTTVEEIDGTEYDIVYVASSDRRHGGGGSASDKGVDANSGQINKLIIDKFSGEVVDSYAVIRGLPRSSENHSTNGLDLAVDDNGDVIMYIAQGGNTNKGAPSNNFVGFIDNSLSGTILKVNLTELESYDVRTDAAGEKFILDVPTLNDPGREDVDLSTLNIQNLEADPLFSMDVAPGTAPEWAGSSDAGNGTNSAKITSHVLVSEDGQLKLVDNPMSVFQPGYRNQYDVHVTENGEVVSWDNGPNGGWGGQPIPLVDQGGNPNYVVDWRTELATNDFNESGSSTFGDYLHVGGKVSDEFGPYAGDANPIRAAVEALALAFKQDQPLYIEENGELVINTNVYALADLSAPILDLDGETVLFTDFEQALDFLSRLTPHYEQPNGSWQDVRPDGPASPEGKPLKLMPIDLHTIVAGYDWKSPGSSISDPTKHFDGTDIAGDTAFSPEAELLAPGEDGALSQGGTSSNGLSEYTASSWFGGALKGTIIGTAFGGAKLQFVQLKDTNNDGRSDASEEIGTIGNFGSQPLSVQALGDNGLGDTLIDNDNDGIDDFSGVIFAATYGADNITSFVPGGTPTDPTVDADGDGINDTNDTHAWGADNGKGVLIGSFFGPTEARWHMELSSDARPDGAATTFGPAPDAGIVAAWKNGEDAARDGEIFDSGNFDIGGASSFLSVGVAPVGSAEGSANAQKDALAVGAILSPSLAGATITAEMLNIFDYQVNADANKTWDGGEKVGIFVGPDQSTFMHAAVVVQANGTAELELYTETDDDDAQSQTVALTGVESPLDQPNQDSVIQIGFAIDLAAETAVARARYQNPNLDGDPATADADWSEWFETAALAIPQAVLASLYGDHVNFGNEVGATIGMFANAPANDDSFAGSWDYVEVVGIPKEQMEGEVLYRWNAGGTNVDAIDGGPDWLANPVGFAKTGSNKVSTHNFGEPGNLHASVPAETTPADIYDKEWWANSAASPLGLQFGAGSLAAGDYAVRLFMGNGYGGTSGSGERVFDVEIEGDLAFDDVDLSATFGHQIGGMLEWTGSVTDGTINIDFVKGVENPLINAIEIIALGSGDEGVVVSILGGTFGEADGTTGVTVETDVPVPADETVTVNWEVRAVAGGATPEVDFTVPGGSFISHTGDGVYQGQSEIAGGSSDVTIPISVTDDTIVEADELFEVVITGVSGANATTGTDTATVTIEDNDVAIPTGGVIYRVNAGGAEIAATDGGIAWSEDQSAATGGPLSVANGQANAGTPSIHLDTSITDQAFGAAFSGTNGTDVPDVVFTTERYGQINSAAQGSTTLAYDFEVPSGDYVVNLYFAEVWSGANTPGKRVFDVNIEGALAFDDVDLTDDYGFNTVGVASYQAAVIDSNLDVDFLKGSANNPKVSAIEVIALADPEPEDITLDIAGPGDVPENGDIDPTAVAFALTASDDFTGTISVTYTTTVGTAPAVTGSASVPFTNGTGVLVIDVASDDTDDGDEAVAVTLTTATDTAGEPRTIVLGTDTATATVTEDDIVVVDPNDIDGDGIVNTADPFAYDSANGLGNVLAENVVFRQDFDVDGDPFTAGGFTGILVNPDFAAPGASETDPYGDRTTEPTSLVEDGVLKIESSDTDVFKAGGTQADNTIKDNYQLGADVSGVDSFTVEAKIQNGWLGTIPAQYASFGITLGAGGTDDYVKFVVGGFKSAPRLQLAAEDSLDGVKEENATLASQGIVEEDVGGVILRLDVDKSGASPTLVGTAVYLDANGDEIGTMTTTTRTITGSLAAALEGANPLTQNTGGIAYGVSITDWSNGAGNRFVGEWDYLELRGPTVANNPATVSLSPAVFELAEGTDTSQNNVKLADILVSDDGVGTNALTLTGDDAASFAIVAGDTGPELHLKQGVTLDFETQAALSVNVEVDDATIDGTPDASAAFALTVGDVLETPEDSALGQPVGDFSEDHTNPSLVTLAAGSNAIVATQSGDGGPRDYDFVTFVVPEGHELTSMTLTGFDDYDPNVENGTFLGLAEGATFPFAYSDLNAVDSTLLLGGAVYFEGEVGDDLLARMADGVVEQGGNAPTQGFTLPLGPGTYTLGFSQNQATATTELDLAVSEIVEPAIGAAFLTITPNAGVQQSNFSNGSFQLTNTGEKKINKFEIDVTNALYPDSVFDPFGDAGDTTAKLLVITPNSGTGVNAPDHGTPENPGTSYIGVGGIAGFEGLQLLFDTDTNGGFETGETVSFAVDMDPNSIAGAAKGTLDSGSSPNWDVGGVSGAELIGSTVTVTFEDGTTATGQLGGNADQSGSIALVTQAPAAAAPVLTVNGLAAGTVGTYGDGGPSVTIQGEAGQTARVVLTKGFIQPVSNNFSGAYADQLQAQLDALAAADFPANNAVEFQTVDILLTGAEQDITGEFNFASVPNFTFAGENQLPLGFVASVIDPETDAPTSAVTAPVYLGYEAPPNADGPFQPNAAGDIVIDANDMDGGDPNGWEVTDELPWLTGGDAIKWTGSQSFSNPSNGQLAYSFEVETTGFYHYGLVSSRLFNAPNASNPATEHNDAFGRLTQDGIDLAAYPVVKNGTEHQPTFTGENGNYNDGWHKMYQSGGELGASNDANKNVDNVAIPLVYFLEAGVTYKAEIAARSNQFLVNSLHLTHAPELGTDPDVVSVTTGLKGVSENAELSVRALTSTAPVIDPIDAQSADEGETLRIDVLATDPDGNDTVALSVAVTGPDGQPVPAEAYAFTDNGDGTGQLVWTTPLVDLDATYTVTLTADDGDNDPVVETFTIDVADSDTGEAREVLFRVNAGGAEVAAADGGLAWSADTDGDPSEFRTGGLAFAKPNLGIDIGGLPADSGAPEAVFQTERYGPTPNNTNGDQTWAFAVDNGLYEVNLYFAEIFIGQSGGGLNKGAGDRIFDVKIEDAVVLDDYDLFAEAGTATAVVKSFEVEITDGAIDIDFDASADNAKISAVEIVKITPATADETGPVVGTAALAAQPGVGSTDPVTVTIAITDAEGFVDLDSLAAEDFTVTFGGVPLAATLATDATADSAALTATLTVAAPVGGWTEGVQDLVVAMDGEILDVAGNTASAASTTLSIEPQSFDQVDGGSATIGITTNGGLAASTFTGSSFTIANTSVSGVQIEKVVFDLSTGILPDMVFDPVGSGGDAVAKVLQINSGGGATGYVAPADPATDPFSQARNGGFDVMELNFTDFGTGESIAFSVDVDPNSIQNGSGSGQAGAVSGAELIGSTISVTFTDGTSTETTLGALFENGTLGGGVSLNSTGDAPAAPSLALASGGTDAVASLPGDQIIVPDTQQTVIVSGQVGATVKLVQLDGRLLENATVGAFDVSDAEVPFYANELMSGKEVFTGTIGANGTAAFDVTLLETAGTPAGGINHFMAVVTDPATGVTSLSSAPLVVIQGTPPSTQPTLDPIGDVTIDEGQTLTVPVTATDPDVGETLTLTLELTDGDGVTVPQTAYTFTDNGDGTGSLEWLTPDVAAAGEVYTATVTASDGVTDPVATSFTVSVADVTPTQTITVYAGGEGAQGIDPSFDLIVDGAVVATQVVAAEDVAFDGTYTAYEITYEAATAAVDVDVRFTNDFWVAPGGVGNDSNLFIEKIEVDGVTYGALDYAEVISDNAELAAQFNLDGVRNDMRLNGVMDFDLTKDPSAPDNTLTLWVGSDAASGVDATFDVFVDGVARGGGIAPSEGFDSAAGTGYAPLTFAWDGPAPSQSATIRFTNDLYVSDAEDRNLWVDRIELNGVTLQAETDATVVSIDAELAAQFDLDGSREDMRLAGDMVFDLRAPDTKTFTVFAGGEAAQGNVPAFEVLANGVSVGSATVSNAVANAGFAGNYAAYDFQVEADVELADVEIVYGNDFWVAPGGVGNDSNLFIDKVALAGVEYQEDAWVFAADPIDGFDETVLNGSREDLRANGTVSFDTPASQTFTVFAGGEAAQGNLPSFKVLVNGSEVGSAAVSNAVADATFAGDYDSFDFEIDAGVALEDIQIVYDSDFWVSPGGVGNDSNLFIDKVALAGVEYQEDAWVFAADPIDGFDETVLNGSREDLRANGTVSFDILDLA